MKRCTRCGEDRPRDEYRPHPNTRDGLGVYCRSCRREYAREHYRLNRERRLAAQLEYEAAHRAEAVARKREWRRRNPERARQLAREDDRRRLVGRDGKAHEYSEVLRGDPCAYCGGASDVVDHVDSLSRGGSNGWMNLTAACRPCNSSKNASRLLPFLLRRKS